MTTTIEETSIGKLWHTGILVNFYWQNSLWN